MRECGCLGNLAAATTLQAVGSRAVQDFAKFGLQKLTNDQFLIDLKPFLDPEKPLGKVVYHAAEVLRDLDEDDATAIGNLFFGERGDLLGSAARRLRQHRDRPIETVLPLVLNQMWDDGLKTVVEIQLKALAKGGGEAADKAEIHSAGAAGSDQVR